MSDIIWTILSGLIAIIALNIILFGIAVIGQALY